MELNDRASFFFILLRKPLQKVCFIRIVNEKRSTFGTYRKADCLLKTKHNKYVVNQKQFELRFTSYDYSFSIFKCLFDLVRQVKYNKTTKWH